MVRRLGPATIGGRQRMRRGIVYRTCRERPLRKRHIFIYIHTTFGDAKGLTTPEELLAASHDTRRTPSRRAVD